MLPLVLLVALAVAQVGLVARDALLVTAAARDAAREAAVSADRSEIRAAALSGGLGSSRLAIEHGSAGPAGSRVEVRVRYRSPTELPLVGRLVGDVDLSARAVMRVE